MASRLKWGLGFSGSTVFLFLAAAYAALKTQGWIQAAAGSVAFVALLYMARQFHKWNGPGWRKYHERAMLAYAGLCGVEVNRATAANEAPDPARACRALWNFLMEAESQVQHRASIQRLESGDAAGALQLMVAEIQRTGPRASPVPTVEDLELNGGQRMAETLAAHRVFAEGRLGRETLEKALRELPNASFGPRTVIFGIVSCFMGEREAANYVVACLQGAAK